MIVVGQTESSQFRTIQSAVDYLENEPTVSTLYILAGVYYETVCIYRSDLRIIGLGQVEIRAAHSAEDVWASGEKYGTFWTATLFLGGRHLWLENLTIINEAGHGEKVGQAIALYAHCHEAVFKNCQFKGHQDTICTGPLPEQQKNGLPFEGQPRREYFEDYYHYYLNCYIEGTVDVIFGGATAYFETCEIKSLKRIRQAPSFVTAASTPAGQAAGFVFDTCFFSGQRGVEHVFLGRPWRSHAQTLLTNCHLGPHIDSKGWDDWGQPTNQQSVQYIEYGTKQKGYQLTARVPWSKQNRKKATLQKEDIFGNNYFWQAWKGERK